MVALTEAEADRIARTESAVADGANDEVAATIQAQPSSAAEAPALPGRTALLAPAPNPFNPQLLIRFDLARSGPVRLAVFDLRGAHVATLVDETRPAGFHSARWKGRDSAGRAMPSGVYTILLWAEGARQVRKAVLAR